METIQFLFSAELIEAFGWTLIHSIWQIALVAICLTMVLLLMRKNSAQAKYIIAFSSLIVVVIWSTNTFQHALRYATEKQALKVAMTSNPDYIKKLINSDHKLQPTDATTNQTALNMQLVEVRSFFQRHFDILCTIWLLGMLFLIIRLIGGLFYTHRLKSTQLTPLSDQWLAIIDETYIKLRLKTPITASFSALAKSPMTIGILKPILLFPATSVTGLSTKQIEAIVAHELAHVLRNDYLFNIIQSMVEIIFFYHPAIWLISSHIRGERENCCDDIAVEITEDKIAYVKALASIQLNHVNGSRLAMGFSSSKHTLLSRIKRLQNNETMKTNALEGAIAAGVIVLGLLFASFTANKQTNTDRAMPETIQTEKSIKPLNASQKDSIRVELAEKIEQANVREKDNKELSKAVEVALSDPDAEQSDKLVIEINNALTEIDINGTIQEVMQEVAKALNEAKLSVNEAMKEINESGMNEEMSEVRRDLIATKKELREDMQHDMTKDGIDQAVIEASIKAAEAGIDIATNVVGSIDLEHLIESTLTGVATALTTIENADKAEVKEEPNGLNKEQIKKIKAAKKQLIKEQDKLQKELDRLDKKQKEFEEN